MVAAIIVTVAVLIALIGGAVVVSRVLEGQHRLGDQLQQHGESLAAVREVSQQTTQRMEGLETRLNPTISRIDQEVGRLSQIATNIREVGEDISSLQDILRPPKVRGGFGEMLLERLLSQILPSANYALPHRFRDGEAVDAVISLGVGLVPVDAKFPMESFSRMVAAQSEEERSRLRKEFVRAVKGHIDAVAKYIRPDEGTLEFAMMYIPAENVYYETIVKADFEVEGSSIQEYAQSRRVFAASPNSFYGYLGAIVLGLRGMHVEEQAKEILGHLGRLRGDFGRFRDDFGVLGRHLTNARNKYDELDRRVVRFGDRLALPLKGEDPEQLTLPAEAATAPEEQPQA